MTLFKKACLLLLPLALVVACVKADRSSTSPDDIEFNMRSGGRPYPMNERLTEYNQKALFQGGEIKLLDMEFFYKGEKTTNIETTGDWKEVNQIWMQFAMCGLRDRASQGTLQAEKFHISSPELGDTVVWTRNEQEKVKLNNPVQVNTDNCLVWSQTIPGFDFLGSAQDNLVIHYEIDSLAGTLGKMVRRIGFNPWDMHRDETLKKRGVRPLTDQARDEWGPGSWLTGSNVVAAIKGEYRPSSAELFMQSVSITPYETQRGADNKVRKKTYEEALESMDDESRLKYDKSIKKLAANKGLHLNINFRAFPYVRLRNSSGIPTDKYKIKEGRFRVYVNILSIGGNTGDVNDGKKDRLYSNGHKTLLTSRVYEVTGASQAYNYFVNENGLIASVPIFLEKDVTGGDVEAVVMVQPMGALSRLEPFMGVYRMGSWDNWRREQNPELATQGFTPLDKINYEKYLEDVGGVRAATSNIRDAERYYFEPFTIRFVRFMPGETATDRTLQYRVETCVRSGISGKRVGRGEHFEITTNDMYSGKTTARRMTDERGCLVWFGFLSHKYYRKEVLEKKVATVRYVGTNPNEGVDDTDNIVNNYKRDFVYYMNPWDEKWTFGWDGRDERMPKNYPAIVEQQRKDAPVSKLFIADFKYTTVGFRYAIDKYLNLKVKKAVLLQAYPYVLKYNSIVRGRLGTEKLRDGVYLMKVALQKDYLDPAARGVSIYDTKLAEDVRLASQEEVDSDECRAEIRQGKVNRGRVQIPYDLKEIPGMSFDEDGNPDLEAFMSLNFQDLVAEGARSEYVTQLQKALAQPKVVFCGDPINEDRLVTDDVLKQSRKQYISIQQKLVRVMGGMIITPIEFQVDDLRLMRIRNQFFIQLQTIDENKLRWATFADRVLEGYSPDNFNTEFQQIYDSLGWVEGDAEQAEDVQERLNQLMHKDAIGRAGADVVRNGLTIDQAQEQINTLFGLVEPGEDASDQEVAEYEDKLAKVKAKLLRVLQYKENGLSVTAAFRESKRDVINSILEELNEKSLTDLEVFNEEGELAKTELQRLAEEVDKEYKEAHQKDPFQRLMLSRAYKDDNNLLARIIKDRIDEENEINDMIFSSSDKKADAQNTVDILNSLSLADFTSSPLTPSFSFDFLRNDGQYFRPDEYEALAKRSIIEADPRILRQNGDDKFKFPTISVPKNIEAASGLPSRTFVGPLTFVFNTNGSSLRPTDILNENYCATAFCEQPVYIDVDGKKYAIKQNVISDRNVLRFGVNDTSEDAVPTRSQVAHALGLDENNQFIGDLGEPIYKSGDSVNAEYENSEYYGYLQKYFGWTVDTLIEEKKKIDVENYRKYEMGSQIINFTKNLRLKHSLVADREESRLKGIDYVNCAMNTPTDRIERDCLYDITEGNLVLQKEDLMAQLNDRQYEDDSLAMAYEGDEISMDDPRTFYNLYTEKFNDDDLNFIIANDVHDIVDKHNHGELSNSESRARLKQLRGFYHRMCFVLSQNFFSDRYFEKSAKRTVDEKRARVPRDKKTHEANQMVVKELESTCQAYVADLYGYAQVKGKKGWFRRGNGSVGELVQDSDDYDIPNPQKFRFPPIVLERKARVFETTDRYVYRGGKSLNINLQAGFNLSSSTGIKTATSASYKPYELAKDLTFAFGGAALATGAAKGAILAGAMTVGMLTGPVGWMAIAATGAVVGIGAKAITGGFGVTRQTGRDESAGRTQGTNVSSGTFLVAQQSSIDIELGHYERCMVARFHPAFVGLFLGASEHLKDSFQDEDYVYVGPDQAKTTDIESYGVMICTGESERSCLPVKEKYYYFTQHFTEGDMLDTADLHNHPWLLQLRGERDFKTFAATIGAREVDYIDGQEWAWDNVKRTLGDFAAFDLESLGGSNVGNRMPEYQIVDKGKDMNWPLEELSRTYFNVLPTFPGLYTFVENKPDWPNFDTDPGAAFPTALPQCEQ